MPRFAARSDLPTPPLPEPMAMMRRPGRSTACGAAGALTLSGSWGSSLSSGESRSTRSGYPLDAPAPRDIDGAARRSILVDELGVPVRRVDHAEERQPLAMRDAAARRAERRRPLGAHRLAHELHADLVRRLRALLQIA